MISTLPFYDKDLSIIRGARPLYIPVYVYKEIIATVIKCSTLPEHIYNEILKLQHRVDKFICKIMKGFLVAYQLLS